MKNEQNRRCFLKNCTKLGISCFTLLALDEQLLANVGSLGLKNGKDDLLDLTKLSICGIECETQCELYKATIENNIELKRKVYDKWNWKEEFGFDFDPDKVFCYGCNPKDKPLKMGTDKCEVRKCALEKEIETCVQCKDLKSCKKEFWKKWTQLYDQTKEFQKQYLSQEGTSLI